MSAHSGVAMANDVCMLPLVGTRAELYFSIFQDRFIFQPSLVLAGHSASINTLAINADGSLLLSGGIQLHPPICLAVNLQ
jgi:hypothetical protein